MKTIKEIKVLLDLIAAGQSCANACHNIGEGIKEDKMLLKQSYAQWEKITKEASVLLKK